MTGAVLVFASGGSSQESTSTTASSWTSRQAGRKAALKRVGPSSPGERLADRHDESHLCAAEQAARAEAEAEVLQWNPLPHIQNLDLSCYDREYAPEPQRRRAREAHLAQWPEAVDASLESLQAVPAAAAGALLPTVRGLAAGINGLTGVEVAALGAHTRLLGRIQDAAASGNPDASLGATALARLLGPAESMPVDLGRLEERADRERDRLRTRLNEACERLSPGVPPSRLVPELLRDHPGEEGIYAAARETIDEATAFVIGNDLLPPPGGACEIGPAPPSRRWAAATMYWTGPFEDDAPARYYVSPPDESWDEQAKHEWLAVFSATMGPVVTVHEVTPGHFAHGRMLRHGQERLTVTPASSVSMAARTSRAVSSRLPAPAIWSKSRPSMKAAKSAARCAGSGTPAAAKRPAITALIAAPVVTRVCRSSARRVASSDSS